MFIDKKAPVVNMGIIWIPDKGGAKPEGNLIKNLGSSQLEHTGIPKCPSQASHSLSIHKTIIAVSIKAISNSFLLVYSSALPRDFCYSKN